MVVLGVLSVMLAIVLVAINPFEMLNKSQDVATNAVNKDFASATKYFYATEKKTPWSNNSTCKDELSTKDKISEMPSCVEELTKGGDLQEKAVNSDEAKNIYMTECGGSVALCYKPKSSTYKKDPTAMYQRNGAPNTACPGGDNCYTCEFSTNEAKECFKIMNPNAEVTPTPSGGPIQVQPLAERPSEEVCDPQASGKAACASQVVTDSKGTPLTTLGTPGGLTPKDLHTVYNLPCTPGGPVAWECATPATFGPRIVAIVVAFHSPTLESDLAAYSSRYKLPACTKANGCLTVVNQDGNSSPLPSTREDWAAEEALDVQTIHAICQTCKILVVETNDNYFSNLTAGVRRAAAMGATSINNSYGGLESYGYLPLYDSAYTQPGVFVTAATGDWGYGAYYPASSKNVIAVGGTSLYLNSDSTYAYESVWSGTGSGCSGANDANSYQTSVSTWSSMGCGTKRGIGDVAAVADPRSGISIYNSTPWSGLSGWYILGGTSLSSPIMAATLAMQTGTNTGNGASYIYANPSKFRDVTSGSNGSCGGSIKCTAGAGYDGPTGLGTPNIIPPAQPSPTGTQPNPTNAPVNYALSDSKALNTYALLYFNKNENPLKSGESGWYLDVSFRSDFGGVIADHKYNPYLYYDPNDADTILNASYAAPGKFSSNPNSPYSIFADSITTNETVYFSTPYIWRKYFDGCGKTMYWRT